MTTLRDILNDLITEAVTECEESPNEDDWADKKELILDDYLRYIKERIVG